MSNILYHQKSYLDFDELSSDIKNWDIDIRLLNGVKQVTKVEQCFDGDSFLSTAYFSGKTLQKGIAPRGITFAILVGKKSEIKNLGKSSQNYF